MPQPGFSPAGTSSPELTPPSIGQAGASERLPVLRNTYNSRKGLNFPYGVYYNNGVGTSAYETWLLAL